MERSTLETLAGRLERVERENRRLKALGLVAVAILASVILMGQARPPRAVEAERFILKNAAGAELGGFIVDDDGRPALIMLSPRDNAPIIALQTIQDGSPAMLLGKPEGTGQIIMRFNDVDSPTIVIRDSDHDELWSAP